MTRYRVKNWEKFQHFRDRRPPWIKLYRELLDDRQWHALDGDSAKVLMMIWLIASEDEDQNGLLPPLEDLAFRLRITAKQLNSYISNLSHWLIQDDISLISGRYQSDTTETEAETYTEEKEKEETKPAKKKRFALPDWISTNDWADFVEMRQRIRKPITDRGKELAVITLGKLRDQGEDVSAVVRQSIEFSYQGFFKMKEQGNAKNTPRKESGWNSEAERIVDECRREAAALAAQGDIDGDAEPGLHLAAPVRQNEI